jgi:hypothetical protein
VNAGSHRRAALVAAGSIVVLLTVVGPRAQARAGGKGPLTAADFQPAALRGFGDRNNSWAQSMVWWHNSLYVGTGRQASCSALFSIWEFVSILVSVDFANTWFPYPPNDPDLSCAPDGADLALQAEIWRWAPDDDAWQRVFQSPLDLDNPGPGAPYPPRTGKKLPYEITIRGMAPHTDPDGTEALYAFGVNSTVMWDRTKLPPPRILRSTDGLTFTPVPQTPGTFLGDLPFNPDHSSFRSPVSYNGKLFVLCGPIFGQGTLIASADPAKGDDAWFLAAPAHLVFYEMAEFNGWLYLGTFSPEFGYAIMKTRAQGTPPYRLTTVVPRGAYLAYRPSRSVVSMHVYQGRLWVGTATMTEVIRINPDDTWDLVVGPPRLVPRRRGGSEWKYPTSNLDAGWGHTLNDHAWQMDAPYGELYIGTYNASIGSKNDPVNGPLLLHNMGAHLYRTKNGWYHSAVTTNGFANPDDPYGGRFDYGIRTMALTPHGAFFGTTNDFYGLAIFRATPHGSSRPEPPDPLEIEPTRSGSALLSWQTSSGAAAAVSYRIWRAEIIPILVRDDVNFEAWNGTFGNKIPDTYVSEYEPVGTSQEAFFIDSTVQPGQRYMYYVVGEKGGQLSEQSNLVTFPVLRPPMTFAQLGQEFERLDERRRFRRPAFKVARVRQQITEAQTLAANCQIGDALSKLDPRMASAVVQAPEAADVEVLTAELVRRLQTFQRLPHEVISDEFCTQTVEANPARVRRHGAR